MMHSVMVLCRWFRISRGFDSADGKDDDTGQCILAKSCVDNNSKNSQNKNKLQTINSTYYGSNSTSPIIDGIILSK
jgi:hypothetical protein